MVGSDGRRFPMAESHLDKGLVMQKTGLVPSRECGECVACCVLPSIDTDTLRKPARTPCRHCTGHHCAVYDSRPDVCRNFYCLWRKLELMGEAHRPDRLGVMFHVVKVTTPLNVLRRLYVVGIPLDPFPNYATPEIEAALVILRRRYVPVWLYFGEVLRCVHPSSAVQDVLLNGAPTSSERVAAEVSAWRKALARS